MAKKTNLKKKVDSEEDDELHSLQKSRNSKQRVSDQRVSSNTSRKRGRPRKDTSLNIGVKHKANSS